MGLKKSLKAKDMSGKYQALSIAIRIYFNGKQKE
jgi:hypothetical protein